MAGLGRNIARHGNLALRGQRWRKDPVRTRTIAGPPVIIEHTVVLPPPPLPPTKAMLRRARYNDVPSFMRQVADELNVTYKQLAELSGLTHSQVMGRAYMPDDGYPGERIMTALMKAVDARLASLIAFRERMQRMDRAHYRYREMVLMKDNDHDNGRSDDRPKPRSGERDASRSGEPGTSD